MTPIYMFFYLIILFIILLIFKRFVNSSERDRKLDVEHRVSEIIMDDIKYGYTLEEIDKYLEWMLMCGIIDVTEFNKKRMECLPFAKRNRL